MNEAMQHPTFDSGDDERQQQAFPHGESVSDLPTQQSTPQPCPPWFDWGMPLRSGSWGEFLIAKSLL